MPWIIKGNRKCKVSTFTDISSKSIEICSNVLAVLNKKIDSIQKFGWQECIDDILMCLLLCMYSVTNVKQNINKGNNVMNYRLFNLFNLQAIHAKMYNLV